MAKLTPEEIKKFKAGGFTSSTKPATEPVTRLSDFFQSDLPEFGAAFKQRAADLADTNIEIEQRDVAGQGRMSSLLQRTGAMGSALAGTVGDIGTLALKAFAKPETEKAVAGVVQDVAQKVGQTDVAQDIGAAYERLKVTNPEMAANIRGALGVTEAALLGASMPIAGGATGLVGSTARKGVTKIVDEAVDTVRNIGEFGTGGITKATEVGLNPASIMQRVARVPKGRQAAFEKLSGESIGDYLVKRGIFGDIDEISSQLYKRFDDSKSAVDNALAQLPGTYRPAAARSMIDEMFAREQRISSPGVPSKNLGRLTELSEKAKTTGLTMSEINEVKRLYEGTVKLDYLKSNVPESVARANTLDDSIRAWQRAKAEELGLKNLKELNRETQLAKQLLNDLGKEYAGSAGNNAITLTDWIVLSGGDPTAVAAFLGKKVGSSKKAMSWVAEKMAGKPTVGIPEAEFQPQMSGYLDWIRSIEGRTNQSPGISPALVPESPSKQSTTLGKTSPAVGQTAGNITKQTVIGGAAGSQAGWEKGEDGKWRFNPAKGFLGLLSGGIIGSQGKRAMSGMSIKDVSKLQEIAKNVDVQDIRIMQDFSSEVLNRVTPSKELSKLVQRMAEEMGLEEATGTNVQLAKAFQEILEYKKANPDRSVPITVSKSIKNPTDPASYPTPEAYVNAQGETVYRGTKPGREKISEATGGNMDFGQGYYFAEKPSTAKIHGDVSEYVVSLKNPFTVKDRYEMNRVWDRFIDQKKEGQNLRDWLKEQGYDGIVVKDGGMGGEKGVGGFRIAFDESQIKTRSQLIDIWKKANNK